MSQSDRNKKKKRSIVSLRATDQETARVVAILSGKKDIVGAGCLVDGASIVTCHHVVGAALARAPKKGDTIRVRLIGVADLPTVACRIEKLGKRRGSEETPINDLALLQLKKKLSIPAAEFATPLRHSGKKYSVLGFPDGAAQGRNASGGLHAADAAGLVQMDGSSALFVKGGFSGAPVWSQDLGAFVGIVVTELSDASVAWCIPSRVICSFYRRLRVRFRIPPSDRPIVHDYQDDDPNKELFGIISDNGERRLTAAIRWQKKKNRFVAKATYERLTRSPSTRGGYVTFVTYPDFLNRREDSYELFAEIKQDKAQVEFYPWESFTIAAIGDGGDTALTFNLADAKNKPKSFK